MGIQSDKVRLLREGSELSLDKAADICRSHEVTLQHMKLFHEECEFDAVSKRRKEEDKRINRFSTIGGKLLTNEQNKDGKTERILI